MKNIKKTFFQTLNGFKELMPMLVGVLLLVSILKKLGVFEVMWKYLQNNFFWAFLADIFWSISVGNTINSYIIAHNFWNLNDNILIITAFLIAWVSVGIVQLPAEMYFFGKKFAIARNLVSFVFAIIWAYIVYFLMTI